jgi:hypothetical protein
MHLVQFLVPLSDNQGAPFPRAMFDRIRDELTEAFGGVTAHVHAPAEGFWKESGDHLIRDRVVGYEILTETLDRVWWKRYREDLTARFQQKELIVRASHVERL